MINFMDLFQIRGRDPRILALLCREVENRVVGVPCGIMDQLSSCAGQEGSLLRLLCQPDEVSNSAATSGRYPRGGNRQRRQSRRRRCNVRQDSLRRLHGSPHHPGKDARSWPRRRGDARIRSHARLIWPISSPTTTKNSSGPSSPSRLDGKSFLAQYGPIQDVEGFASAAGADRSGSCLPRPASHGPSRAGSDEGAEFRESSGNGGGDAAEFSPAKARARQGRPPHVRIAPVLHERRAVGRRRMRRDGAIGPQPPSRGPLRARSPAPAAEERSPFWRTSARKPTPPWPKS